VPRNVLYALDQDDFGSNRSKIMDVIDSNSLEHDVLRKPLRTFRHRALIDALLVGTAVLAFALYEERQQKDGIEISIGQHGISVEKK
jgi:hypothetical protein